MRKIYLSLFCSFIFNFVSAQSPRLVMPLGHTQQVRQAKFSPDGKTVVTVSDDGTGKLWDVRTGKLLYTLLGHQKRINSVAFSPDGSLILTASFDKTAKLWDARNGNLLHDLKGHSDALTDAEFSPDGKTILTASYDFTVRVWNTASGEALYTLKKQNNWINAAAFSSNGKKIITFCGDGYAKVWQEGNLLFSMGRADEGLRKFNVSKDEKKILLVYINTIEIYDLTSGRFLSYISRSDNYYFNDAVFSPDGKLVAAASTKGVVEIYAMAVVSGAVTESKISKQFDMASSYPSLAVRSVAFSSDGKSILAASDNNTACLFFLNGDKAKIFKGHTGKVSTATFSPDEQKVVSASEDRSSCIWDIRTGRLLQKLTGSTSGLGLACISDSGNYIVTSSFNGDSHAWDMDAGRSCAILNSKTTESYDWSPVSYDQNARNTGRYFKAISPYEDEVVLTDGNEACLYNLQTGKKIFDLHGHTQAIISAAFSPDAKWIVTASRDKTAKVWDASTGKLTYTLKGHRTTVGYIIFSPDAKTLLTVSNDCSAKAWDLKTGKCLYRISRSTLPPSGSMASFMGPGFAPFIGWANSYKFLYWLQGKMSNFYNLQSVSFSADSKYLVSTNERDKKIRVWSARSGRLVKKLKGHKGKLIYTEFSPDGTKIISGALDSTAILWNAISGKAIHIFKGHHGAVLIARFNPDQTKIITGSTDNFARVWDAKNYSLLQEIYLGPNSILQDVDFMNQRLICISTSSVKIFDLVTGKEIVSYTAIDSSDFISILPIGYYMTGSSTARSLHYVTSDLRIISFEQLDVKYNRPDKVLEAIGSKDTALISSYRRAYLKRIKKLGIDTAAFTDGYNVPEAEIANRDQVAEEVQDDKLALHIRCSDTKEKLDRFNIWVNEVPVFGLKGLSIKAQNKYSFDTTVTIILSAGDNQVQSSVINNAGIESYRMPLYVKYSPVKPVLETIHFIGIGIDHFSDPQYDLHYSTKDIHDLCLKLKEKAGARLIIDTLFNKEVTLDKVKALKIALQKTGVNDKVILAYSGHGLLSKEYDYYLSTYSINFSRPEQNGLPYDELEHLLDSIPARKKLMLIDACHSGEVDKEEFFVANHKADSIGLSKGSQILPEQHQQLGLRNSFELMQSLFVNVSKNTGTVIISAAAGNQFALEKGNLQNGVFTYCILEAMNNYPALRISELKSSVSRRVEEITGGLQKPTFRNETNGADWEIW
jgi:WD40 repeat protein